MLGICSQTLEGPILVKTQHSGVIEKFVKLSIDEFGIEANKILISESHGFSEAKFYNSKLKKLMADALERRTRLFKYHNDYSAEYTAGMFDAYGGINQKGLYINGISSSDMLVLENLGIHTMQQGQRSYILNQAAFIDLVAGHSVLTSKVKPRRKP